MSHLPPVCTYSMYVEEEEGLILSQDEHKLDGSHV